MESSWISFLVSVLIVAICTSLRVSEVEAANAAPEINDKPCVRDIDCMFKHLPHCKGFFVCDHGKCDCIPGTSYEASSPKSDVDQADDKPCVHDIDCTFKHLSHCKGFFVCNRGKCDCIQGIFSHEAYSPPCRRNIECALRKSPSCSGTYVCNIGRCGCLPAPPNSSANPELAK